MSLYGQLTQKKNTMKKSKSFTGLLLLLAGLALMLISYIFGIPQGEGFNPSDDGVILAQSFRLLSGQLPHIDFISIRPVGSAVFHSINFSLPIPLELSARWLTLLEYLIFSFLMGWLLVKTMINKTDRFFILIGIPVLMFVLNQNHYNLFPWTTIDAIFFFSIGFFIFWNWKTVQLGKLESVAQYFMIILFVGFSALCRQSFALPVFVLALVVLFDSIAKKRLGAFLVGSLVGLFPYWLYAFMLIKNDGFGLFVEQMTGRTELWQTGMVKYASEMWNSSLLFVFIILIGTFLFFRLSGSKSIKTILNNKIKNWIVSMLITLVLILAAFVFIRPEYLFKYSFVFFWLLVVLLIIQPMFTKQKSGIANLSLWILFIAWTSSISLGDNAPVFAMGLLSGALLVLLLSWFTKSEWLVLRFLYVRRIVLGLLTLLFVGLSIYGQKSNNYRDLSSERLHFSLEKEFPGLGKIKTNPRTYQYLKEIHKLFSELDKPVNRFVVLPNASLIYPLLDTHNPMPLDWMQGPEFIGQERRLNELISEMDRGEGIYLLFDKYNSKVLADSLIPMTYTDDMYPYYSKLQDESTEIDIVSDWFEVRLLK